MPPTEVSPSTVQNTSFSTLEKTLDLEQDFEVSPVYKPNQASKKTAVFEISGSTNKKLKIYHNNNISKSVHNLATTSKIQMDKTTPIRNVSSTHRPEIISDRGKNN